MKNVIALAAGMVDGIGFGANTKGALITRGLTELASLVKRLVENARRLWDFREWEI